MKLEESNAYVARCFNGEPASCSFACPFSLDIRSYLEKVSKGRWAPAYKLLRNAVVFPAVVAALCPQPCRGHCQRTQLGDEALAMSDLETACVRYAKNRKAELYVIPPKTQRIAVVGAGPAGLACALSLAQKRYIVTVFDKAPGWGGSLRRHPRFSEFEEDFMLQFSGVEAEFRYDTEITGLGALDDYDAVYVATGRSGADFGLLDSWDRALLTTSNPKVFLGGELTGEDLMEAIALGNEASKIIESYLLAGKASRAPGPDRTNCERYLRHDGEAKKPLVQKSEGEVYTEEEAKAEAARCFQCDCDYCEASCEMLKSFRKKPKKLGLEVFTDSSANSLVSTHTLTRETYSCNICGHCKAVCPVNVDMGDLLQFSRTDRVAQGLQVPAFHDYWLREMDFNSTEGAYASAPKGKKA
ncbi:NADPH-dependent glutamate synthase beta chain [Sporobacter termitidis DSM 10068]|uniref:NADPH-dependent glutamate synthase beta chain n=1 Tax=Sporobacter termitidis DSM 10068 TaxID=1123282 RepID=A0A1M5ZAY6_9FIRM|nr:NAD(P)-binding protein [Sporobacter termitidis]SHI21396.1 NADPH-dependent glutamate synthase beta chain [Sporobacter termitidis DSM 10068]